MTTTRVQYEAPGTIEGALQALERAGPSARVLAGGTDLLPRVRKRLCPAPGAVINIKAIPELTGVVVDPAADAAIIGAATTVTAIEESLDLARHLPLLPAVANRLACPQIRNMATIGGNVCNASPAGDLILPLIVLGAQARLWRLEHGRAESRLLPVEELFLGPGATVIASAEILGAFHVPLPHGGFGGAFEKFGRRPSMDVSAVSVAAGAEIDAAGKLTNCRVAYGAVAPTPLRGQQVEAVLEGRQLTPELFVEAQAAARTEVRPIDDPRASAEYRREIAGVLLGRVLRRIAGPALEEVTP